MGKFLRSTVKAASAAIEARPRQLAGMSAKNMLISKRRRTRLKAYMPGDPWHLANLMFDDGLEHPVLEPGGQYVQRVNIGYTGTRASDFHVANMSCGFAITPAGHVWHHFHDYNSPTVGGIRLAGRGTLYLMKRADHRAFHYGGCEQYRQVHGAGY